MQLIRRWRSLTVTIGDQSYSGATFISSTVTDGTNAERLVITLADDVEQRGTDRRGSKGVCDL